MSTLRVNTLQNTSTTDGGISINNSGHVTVDSVAMPSAGPLSNRNLIINGAMQVWQRSTSVAGVADNTNEGYQSVDRYGFSFGSTHGGACTISKSTTVPSGEGFAQSYKVDVTTSATPTANQLTAIYTKIEAQDIANSGWDYTSTSSYITLSFWARSSKAGTYCVYIDSQDAATYEKYVKEYTLVADTWKRVEITVPGKSTLAYNNDNGEGMLVYWTLSAGSSRNGSTADTWETGNNVATSNQVNFFDSTSNDFYLTGVQLEVGSVATPIEHRSYGDELARCLRYYYRLYADSGRTFAVGYNQNTTATRNIIHFPVTMRSAPTALEQIGTASNYRVLIGTTVISCSAVPTLNSTTTNTGEVQATVSSGLTAGQGNCLESNVNGTYLGFTAEL